MESSSYFIKDKALFGSYPSQCSVEELEKEGVIYFINLTRDDEKKIIPYTTNHGYIHYPIPDQCVPENLPDFARFILRVVKIILDLKLNEKVYINCKGGHGRSGLVVAAILCQIFNLTPFESLKYTSQCHSNRKNMRERWRKIGAPQTYSQKKFVYKFFHPVNMNTLLKNILNHNLSIVGVKDFANVQETFLFYKEKFSEDQKSELFLPFIKRKKVVEWENIHELILQSIILRVFQENNPMKQYFSSSLLRPIVISYIESHVFWRNCGIDLQKFARILTNLRTDFLNENEKEVVDSRILGL